MPARESCRCDFPVRKLPKRQAGLPITCFARFWNPIEIHVTRSGIRSRPSGASGRIPDEHVTLANETLQVLGIFNKSRFTLVALPLSGLSTVVLLPLFPPPQLVPKNAPTFVARYSLGLLSTVSTLAATFSTNVPQFRSCLSTS